MAQRWIAVLVSLLHACNWILSEAEVQCSALAAGRWLYIRQGRYLLCGILQVLEAFLQWLCVGGGCSWRFCWHKAASQADRHDLAIDAARKPKLHMH